MELWNQSLILFITLFAMMLGVVLTLVPVIPGTIIIWGAAIFYGLMLGWEELGWVTFGLMTFFMLLGIIADVAGGQFGAKLGGASCLAILVGTILGFILGLIGSIVGTPVIGCLAGIFGTLGGILLVERLRYSDWRSAWLATKGFMAGTGLGIIARITSGIIMFAIFVTSVLFMQ